MTDRIRTAEETAAQRPQIAAGFVAAQLRTAYRENARLRQQRDEAIAERAAAQRELADLRIQRDRLAADHTALTARHHAQGQELDAARQEAIRLGHELHLRDAVAPYAEANADEKQLADLRAQLGAALDANDTLALTLAEVLGNFTLPGHPGQPCKRSGWVKVATIHRWHRALHEAEDVRNTQQPTAPDPAEQLVAAHRAGYDQAIDNLRDRDRFIAWQMSDSPRGGGTLIVDYLADTYEIPA